jgi:hypothetical protein
MSMPKVTQNRVYNSDGSIVLLDGTAESFVGFLSKFNALRYVQATAKETDTEGKVTLKPLFNEDGSPKMIARPRNGYTQYFNNDGFTNPISPEALSPQGIGKLLAKLYEVAAVIQRSGTKRADEMKTILAGVDAYRAVAESEVAKAADNTAMEQALAVLTKASGGDVSAAQAKLAEFLKSKGINAPAPTVSQPSEVAPSSVTVTEAVEAASESSDETESSEPQAVDTALSVDEPTEPTAAEAETVETESVEPTEQTA